MAISEEQVRHVALLARLALTDEQVAEYGEQLNSILEHIDTIRQLDLEGVEPTAHAVDMVNETRADEPLPCLPLDAVLLNAPEAEDGAFVVPRIVAGGDEA